MGNRGVRSSPRFGVPRVLSIEAQARERFEQRINPNRAPKEIHACGACKFQTKDRRKFNQHRREGCL